MQLWMPSMARAISARESLRGFPPSRADSRAKVSARSLRRVAVLRRMAMRSHVGMCSERSVWRAAAVERAFSTVAASAISTEPMGELSKGAVTWRVPSAEGGAPGTRVLKWDLVDMVFLL